MRVDVHASSVLKLNCSSAHLKRDLLQEGTREVNHCVFYCKDECMCTSGGSTSQGAAVGAGGEVMSELQNANGRKALLYGETRVIYHGWEETQTLTAQIAGSLFVLTKYQILILTVFSFKSIGIFLPGASLACRKSCCMKVQTQVLLWFILQCCSANPLEFSA